MESGLTKYTLEIASEYTQYVRLVREDTEVKLPNIDGYRTGLAMEIGPDGARCAGTMIELHDAANECAYVTGPHPTDIGLGEELHAKLIMRSVGAVWN